MTAPSTGLSPGLVSLLARATYDSGTTLISAAQVNVPAPSLLSTFNNTGITNDSNPSPSPGFAGFDGIGTTYSAEGLAADGLTPGAVLRAGGLTFTWPDAAPAAPDNTMAEGQTIAVTGSGSTLGFVAAANNSAESGTGTIYYTDGSSQGFYVEYGEFLVRGRCERQPRQRRRGRGELCQFPDRFLRS